VRGVLARGVSKRFSGDNVLTAVEGKPMVKRVTETLLVSRRWSQ